MDKQILHQLHTDFERCANTDEATGVEYWFARDLQKLLGYSQWWNFEPVIEKAIAACGNAGENPDDHFARARKMIETGKTAQREVDEIALTRYACYLIAQNGDPRKTEIAFAQSYFAVQTRKMELVEKRLEEIERLEAKSRTSTSRRKTCGAILFNGTLCTFFSLRTLCTLRLNPFFTAKTQRAQGLRSERKSTIRGIFST